MVIIQPHTVSGDRYPVSMNDKSVEPAASRPVFIEVPKPVKDMSAVEREFFIEQIVQALSESTSKEERA